LEVTGRWTDDIGWKIRSNGTCDHHGDKKVTKVGVFHQFNDSEMHPDIPQVDLSSVSARSPPERLPGIAKPGYSPWIFKAPRIFPFSILFRLSTSFNQELTFESVLYVEYGGKVGISLDPSPPYELPSVSLHTDTMSH